jgi:hypothetical protein
MAEGGRPRAVPSTISVRDNAAATCGDDAAGVEVNAVILCQ